MLKKPVIIFEGIETSGKSTNIKIASNYLKSINRNFVKIREPGGSKFSEKIRNIILNKKSNLNIKTDLLLMLASRSENIDKILKKNYKKKIILIDRFSDSTFAYQHYGMNLDFKMISQINKFIIGDFKPNLTFLSVVRKNDMKKRLNSRKHKNKYDKFNYNFYNKVQKGYLQLSKNKKKYVILDSSKYNINDIRKKIINSLTKVI
tara:strand:- start:612 stop:1226 length:615 start_codon:yes stop_codon:yes gene_type:complete